MFFVYQLEDPRNGEAFFYGIARGSRLNIQAELASAKVQQHTPTYKRIRAIWEAEQLVGMTLLHECMQEENAVLCHHELVAKQQLEGDGIRTPMGLARRNVALKYHLMLHLKDCLKRAPEQEMTRRVRLRRLVEAAQKEVGCQVFLAFFIKRYLGIIG